MNTINYNSAGWGSLIVAGGAAYYFAKQNIDADRRTRLEEQRKRKSMVESLEYSENVPTRPLSSSAMGGSNAAGVTNGGPARTDAVGSPSQETGNDPAPTRHAPATESERVFEKSKYEASAPFKSTKGDRFS
ncbi:hypothetical protein QBC35DRAFT_476738 [Podospora australis]|uniref:Uncharacterized protein n=1 Tax=Podospora australis TaxID=1536484 RepID=A0AAN6WMW9_9PEZI|nr:hypothetical protein QBC35DRAFT_476738 [Podospora australis]